MAYREKVSLEVNVEVPTLSEFEGDRDDTLNWSPQSLRVWKTIEHSRGTSALGQSQTPRHSHVDCAKNQLVMSATSSAPLIPTIDSDFSEVASLKDCDINAEEDVMTGKSDFEPHDPNEVLLSDDDEEKIMRRRLKNERITSQALLIEMLDPPSFNMSDVYNFSVFSEKRKELERMRDDDATLDVELPTNERKSFMRGENGDEPTHTDESTDASSASKGLFSSLGSSRRSPQAPPTVIRKLMRRLSRTPRQSRSSEM